MGFNFTRATYLVLLGVTATLGAWPWASLTACDTPVYRYAMYRWPPAPYEVYLFHNGDERPKDKEIAGLLESYWEDQENPANVVFLPVDLTKENALQRVPPDVREAFEKRDQPNLPAYMVTTPFGVELYFGDLSKEDVKELVESPARKQLAEELADGKIGVFVFFPSEDEKATAESEKVLTDLARDLKEGKLEIYTSPFGPPIGEEGEQAGPPPPELGVIKVDRNDPKEKWFVRAIMAVEPELEKETGPMTFLVYGRGRALLPYIGKGINRDNLLYEIDFVTGACSCTVKEQNPGVDLLVRANWDLAAQRLAEKFGAEEGYGPGMFYPELLIPSGPAEEEAQEMAADDAGSQPAAPEATDLATGETASEESEGPSGEQVAEAEVDLAATEPDAPSAADATAESTDQTVEAAASDAERPQEAGDATAVASADTPVASAASESVSSDEPAASFSSVYIVATGVIVVLIVLFGVTFYVLRPQ